MFRASLAALLVAAICAPATANPSSAPAAAGSGHPSISVSDPTAILGKPVHVTGTGPGLRRLALQLKTKENGWQEVAGTLTGPSGNYTFVAPGWVGSHRLRVVVPGTLVSDDQVSRAVTVTVRVPYRPKGAKSDWAWLSHRGARWDPCEPITFRINPAGSYRGAVPDIRRTFTRVGRITGFRFKYLGRTEVRVQRARYGYHPGGTDVVVDWQPPRQEPGLAGGIAGIGGHWVQDGRRFDGYMLLDQTERHSRTTWRQVMSHELGHILGLGHADTRLQLMYGRSTPSNRLWGNGDLTALRRVGASRGCLPATSDRPSGAMAMTRVDAR